MSCNNSRITTIELNLKTNPSIVSENDLIYYLYCNSNNNLLDYNNIENTKNYLKKIELSFSYENIFINTSNYSSTVPIIIGLLIPFYYLYPRLYNIGFLGMSIGIFSFLSLFSKMVNQYSSFFNNIGIIYISTTVLFYIIFFIFFNKLNHISLFFISAVIIYFFFNYILRLILTSPAKTNKYNKNRANTKDNKNNTSEDKKNYTEYNLLIEIACLEMIKKFNLKVSSGNMLYSYFTEFEIGDNKDVLSDFLTNLFGPLLYIGILIFLIFFLSIIKDEKDDQTYLFPLIGNNFIKYHLCQASYILPKELNVNLLIYNILKEYNFDDLIYGKFQKVLLRISDELLKKYNPKFYNDDKDFINIVNNDIIKNKIFNQLKNNKIFNEILKLFKEKLPNENINPLDKNYRQEIRDIIYNKDIPYKNKKEMFDLLEHIDNILTIVNDYDPYYENDSLLAMKEFLYDKEIKEEYKKDLKDIIVIFVENFKKNLNIELPIEFKEKTFKYEKENKSKRTETYKLLGYHYNIWGYLFLPDFIRNPIKRISNKIFNYILTILSTWLFLAKPIGSPWILTKYILNSKNTNILFNDLLNKSILTKYFTMGLDKTYFEENITNKNETEPFSIIKILLIIFTFIIVSIILYLYNSSVFSLNAMPGWYNLIYQIIFYFIILGNYFTYIKKGNLINFNSTLIILFILFIIIIALIVYFTS